MKLILSEHARMITMTFLHKLIGNSIKEVFKKIQYRKNPIIAKNSEGYR